MLEVYRSSRLERLADLLLVKLRTSPPASVLQAQSVVVGHLGMKRWLLRHLAERTLVDGKPGIAANLRLQLPGEWLDELSQRRLGSERVAVDPYQRQHLRWRIYQLLPELEQAQISRYLDADRDGRRRFQLADRLASLYVQYAVYRADWLAGWEGRGSIATTLAEHWQGELWRRLRAGIGVDHRAARGQALLSALAQSKGGANPLHVFGVNHLPPDVLKALLAVARTQPVMLYFPDPCRELWDDLRSRADSLIELDPDSELHSDHRLLAALGKLGQHFTVLLNNHSDQIDDRRDEVDREQAALPAHAPLLTRLQHSVRTLQPQIGGEDIVEQDSSLRVHVCHTRLRELEALRDALLDFLSSDAAAEPRDIVVMAPDINQYAPYLAAVFGPPGRHQGALPYHLADVPMRRSHPLLRAFAELLDLPQQRLGRSQILAMLDLPAVARRMRLQPGSAEALSRWLDRAEVAWGLDAAMKTEFGAAPVAQNSFEFGLERMLAGFLLGEVEAEHLLDGEILPALPPHGPDADALGALDQLLSVLAAMRSAMRQSRSVSDWCAWLSAAVNALFEGGFDDADETVALRSVHACIDELRTQTEAAQSDPQVPFAVIREALLASLDGVPERQPFLVGGITFCGMVPQRAIPFRMVCVLGLNDGEFPRNRSDSGLDLLRSHPRLGDRDARADDRYLFLEALLSARDRLHLSYLGEGVQDGKPRNPAAPLAELLQFLRPLPTGPEVWIVRHPLQPFDARYYDAADSRLHSFDGRWLVEQQAAQEGAAPGFRSGLPEAPAMPQIEVDLRELLRWYRDPAREYCQNTLGLSLQALEQVAADDREPLAIRLQPLERLTRDLVWRALDRGEWEIPAQLPVDIARSGRLPAGSLGRRSYALERGIAQRTLNELRDFPPFQQPPEQRQIESVGIDLSLSAQIRLRGEVSRVYRVDDRRYLLELCPGKVNFKHLLPLYLRLAALRLSLPERCLVRGLVVGPEGKNRSPERFPNDHDQLRAALSRLLLLWYRGQNRPPLYLPKTSWRYLESDNPNLYAAQIAMHGGYQSMGELDYAPGYARLLFADLDLLDAEHPERKRFEQCARMLHAIINPEQSGA